MRSHAKASSAGSSMRRANGLDRAIRGAVAARGVSGDSDGSGAPTSRRSHFRIVALLCFTVTAAMALTATPALAVKTHLYTGASFGPDGTSATSFGNPQGLTTDQSTGDVYVYDVSGGGKVYKFDASGSPINFSALGSNVITGVGGAGGGEEELAVAPAGSPGGTAGDIYVANNAVIKIYSPGGTELGQLSGGETCGVATNPAGHVFVGVYPSTVREYVPSANPTINADQSGASTASLPGICNVAADGTANVYAANYSGNSVAKLEGLADASATAIEPGASTMAIDPSSNDLYADRGSEVAQYSSAGALIGTFGSGQLTGSHGIAVNGTSGKVYVNGTGNKVAVFGPTVIAAAVTVNAPSTVHSTLATLNATVNADGVAVTECKFEYGTTTAYGSTKPCEGSIPADSSDHAVTGAITGLTPGTTYHFRVSATNANGTSRSSDLTFNTIAPAETNSATAISGTKATLNGTVSPDNETVTECKFEYGKTTAYGSSIPCEGSIPTDESSHPVTAALTHLVPNDTTYHFRLVVVRASGTSQSSDRSFSTATTVITEPASGMTGTGSTVHGTLNPEGIEYVECKFEYGLTSSYGSSAPCAESPAAIGTGSSPISVHADLSGLVTGTIYHFRLVAVNVDGSAAGAEATFATLGALISEEFASQVGATAAKLNGQVNPKGSFTTYHFEYGSQGPCSANPCTSRPVPDGSVGGGTTNTSVSTSLTGLLADTTYSFRLVATNPNGTTVGPDATFNTFPPAPSFAACPNDQFRTGSSAKLPDCRAYEQVSPIDKHGSHVTGDLDKFQASTSGDAVTFFSNAGIPGGVGSQDFPFYLGRRTADGWSTEGLLPPPSYGVRAFIGAWTPDLRYVFSLAWTPGNPIGFFVRSPDGSLAKIADSPAGIQLVGVSGDGSKVFFQAETRLTPEAPSGKNLYVWNRATSTVSLAGILPDSACGTPPCIPADGSFGGGFSWFGRSPSLSFNDDQSLLQDEHAVSVNGDLAFFTEADTGQLYLRKNAAGPGATTVKVNASQRTAPDPNGPKPAAFMRATPSGSIAFFLSCEKLTDDSTAFSSTLADSCDPEGEGIEGADLYAFDAASGHLTDLTVDPTSDPKGADVRGVIGASDDGSYVYFAANGDLDNGGPAAQGDCSYDGGNNPIGSCSLYVYHAGSITFIARLDTDLTADSGGASNWKPAYNDGFQGNRKTGFVSANGKVVLFDSQAELTPQAKGTQMYRYHVGDPGPTCITCDPTGNTAGGGFLQGVKATGQVYPDSGSNSITRNLSADGNRIVFGSRAKLVAGDTNGDGGCPNNVGFWGQPACEDVYEWEASGTGSCHSTAQNGGCIYLLSNGASSEPAFLGDESSSGDDVFIVTAAPLVPQDTDELQDVYDVKVGGGLAAQHAVQPPVCTGDACRGPASSGPSQQGAGTAVFSGPGNPPVRRQKPRKHRHKKRHHRTAHKQTAASRGGSK